MGLYRLFPIQRRTAIAVLSVLLAMAAAVSGMRGYAQDKTIAIDGRSAGRIFDGLGALSAGASTRLLVD